MADTTLAQFNLLQTAIDAGRALAEPIILPGAKPALVVPKDYRTEDIERFLPRPVTRRGVVKFWEVDSFADYINRHKNATTHLFGKVTEKTASFRAHLDYHDTFLGPAWCHDHVADFQPVLTVNWTRWMSKDRQPFNQESFALFIEENMEIFASPSGADLLELVGTLEGKRNVRFNSGVKLTNGANKLSYDEDVELSGGVGTGQIVIPSKFILNLMPFEGMPHGYTMEARLRYRIEGRKLSFWYETINPHVAIRDAFDTMLERIGELTKMKTLFGEAS